MAKNGNCDVRNPANGGRLAQAPENPLLKAWQTPFETPPFAEIAPEHFLPAFEQAFADHAAEIAAITHDPATPDFANTITALERAGKLLSRVAAVFYDLVSAHSNPALLEVDKEVSLRMARHWNPIMMNAVLFGRIALLHDNRATLGLTGEQMRLLERTYTRFHRSGAGLDEAAKKRMAEINERLAHLGTTFSHHLLGDEQDWFMELGEADRDGLSDSFVAAAKAAAEERGMAGKAVDDAVALLRRAVPEELRPGATCARRCSRPSPRAATTTTPTTITRPSSRYWPARGERQAAGLPDLRRLPAGGFHGQDAGSRARPAGAGLEAGPGPGARRTATTCRRWWRKRAAISRWRHGTGATTPKSCGSAAPISTMPRSSPIWRSTT